MKTSNKFILGALAIFVISLGIYNNALKAEYHKGTYKSPYNLLEKIPINGFSEIQLNAANMMTVEIKQGPFAVYVARQNEDSVQLKKIGTRLVVDLNMNEKPDMIADYNTDGPRKKYVSEYRLNRLIIVCPNISLLKTDDAFLIKGQKQDKYEYSDEPDGFNTKPITLTMFKLDSLVVEAKGRGEISLSGNVIKALKTDIGRRATLIINSGNYIENIDLKAETGSQVILHDLSFRFAPSVNSAGRQTSPHIKYDIADSAKLKLDGFSFKLLTRK